MNYYKDKENNVYAYDDEAIADIVSVDEEGKETTTPSLWIKDKIKMTDEDMNLHLNPPMSLEDIKQEIINKVQTLIDDTAKAKGYDDMNSVAKYLRPTSSFYDEAVALLDWTDSVWVVLYEIQASIGDTIPAVDEVLAQIPLFGVVK